MRSEFAFHIEGLEYFRKQGVRNNPLNEMSDQSQPGGGVFNWMPGGWYDQNLLTIGEYYRDYIFPSVDETNHTVDPKPGTAMERDLSKHRAGPYNIFAKVLLPAYGKAALRSARAQTFVDETFVACALERYRMEHNVFPDTLEALTPQFISKIPNDLFNGGPLHYKKTDNDGYILYSIGWDEKDDGGSMVMKPGSTPKVETTVGDWVWQYPAK
jgi:hypothetical protein